MYNLLVGYTGNEVFLNGDIKSEGEAVDIMSSLGLTSTDAWRLLQKAKMKQETVSINL